ncbi:MAG: ATP-binding cassette domain-containing protein [Acidimicrobiia bacterium]
MTGVDFRRVGVAYPGRADDPVLEEFDLSIASGEVLLVVGSSGSGKSTLLRCVNGLVPHATGGSFRGEVVVGGRSTRHETPRELADVVGFVHQDPEAHFVVDRVEEDIAFGLENLGADPATMRRRVEEALDALGIAHLRGRSPGTLSGGERQRAAVAGALALAPAVLVLDEPTSELDPQGADDVLSALARLNADLGTTVLLAEHRLERAAPMADRAAVLARSSDAAATVTAIGDPATTVSAYSGAPTVTHLGRVLGWEPLPLTVKQARGFAQSRPARLGEPPRSHGAGAEGPGDVLVSSSRLEIRQGATTVLRDVDSEVREGEVVVVLGRNGSGKSSLLTTLAGLHDEHAGSVTRSATVAYVPQDPNAMLFRPTVREELLETLRLTARRGTSTRSPTTAQGDSDGARVDHWLDRLRLTALADRHPRTLSSGERQRAAVAAVAVGGARVLLLDEPTRGMDAESRTALEHALREHTAGGGAAVLATHDVELAARVATRAIVLGDGDIVASGDAREVLTDSLFAPQTLRVVPPFLTVGEVERALSEADTP